MDEKSEHDPALPLPEPKPKPAKAEPKPDPCKSCPPKPRKDGKCVECERQPAQTRDKLLCFRCLRSWAKHQNELPWDQRWSERYDRPMPVDPNAISGCAELNNDGDDW